METPNLKITNCKLSYLLVVILFLSAYAETIAQTVTSPQVPFLQRTSAASPAQTTYNIKGDFTMLGNTNLTLVNYGLSTNNESNQMKYVDTDGDTNTWNSSMATLELSNSGENSASQNCSSIIFAGLYWTGKSDDNDIFTVTKSVEDTNAPIQQVIENYEVNHQGAIAHSDYSMTVTRLGSSNNYYPRYTFTSTVSGQPIIVFEVSNSFQVKYSINGGSWIIPGNQNIYDNTPNTDSKEITFDSVTIYTGSGIVLTVNKLRRDEDDDESSNNTEDHSFAYGTITYDGYPLISVDKNFDKKKISIKGPGAPGYTTITAKPNGTNSEIRFPGSSNSGIFVGYQEITDYVKTYGSGAYTIADIALTEGTNSNPGLSGGWVMVVIYENPLMKSRAVTLFDGYAYVNGQLSGGGEYGNIDISGFTTVGLGPVNMKLGVMAAEGDVGATSGSDYLAVQKLNANPAVYNTTNYLTLNHARNSTTNFFNSSIYPVPAIGTSNPILQNNTGVDFSMFTIPNANNSVIGNNQTSTTFRFGSTYEVFTIFGFAMSVDAYIPDPKGLISVNSINNVTNPAILNALPGQSINYSLNITNEGTEATNNTIITIPIPATTIFHTGTIVYHTYNGFTTTNIPSFDSGTNKIIWNLGTLPITAGHPEYIYADISFTIDVSTDCAIILNVGCSPEVSLETGAITGTGAISGSSFTKYFFQGYDGTSCHLPIDGSIKVAIDASSCFSSMAGPDQITSCGGEFVTLTAATGSTGIWSIVSGPAGGGEIFSNNTSPSSTFYSPNLGVYTLRWTTNCATTDDVVITFTLCNVVNFDGIDDHINFKNNFNLNSGNFSIEAWVKSNAANGNTQSILSKHLSPSSSDGYDLRLVNNFISFNWNNNSITADHAIDTNRWYHIAVTFDGANYKLYIDGILEKNNSGANPIINSVDCILGAMSQNTNSTYNYYNGWADELRMWNVSLTVEQIRQMMNQEITNDGSGNVKGVIVPINISGLSWANLAGYYQMNRASDISNGHLVDKSGNSKNGKLKGIYVQEPDSAPIPYTSGANGCWETDSAWTNSSVWDSPNSFGIDGTTKIDWNIVQTSHNITSSDKNIIVLGLISTAGTLTIAKPSEALNENNSGLSLRITHYLELDGAIDLVGESQLLQDEGSILDQDSGGYIERDQQGTANSYNYNYWSSSVGTISGNIALRGTGVASTNTSHTLLNILKDGTTATNPGAISFNTPYTWADNTYTGSKRISAYWLYTFNGADNSYGAWKSINQNTPVKAGEGYTMKGTSGSVSITNKQNYVFKGKPNNGDIKLPILVGNDRLIGNPYASAIDANEFIKDNIKETINSKAGRNTKNIFNGALYFWDHFGEKNTHILREYVGGYATFNLIGGAEAISNDTRINNNNAVGTKIPQQYIPVNQGFFVIAALDVSLTNTTTTIEGGDIVFKNSQRIFKTEVLGESVFMKTANSKSNLSTGEKKDKDNEENNSNSIKRSRIWLRFNSPSGYHRQLLVGVDKNASNHFDLGYDAPIADIGKEDMFWTFDSSKFVIQGVDNFDKKQELPLGLKIFKAGLASIKIDKTENLDKKVDIYIKDKLTGISYEISKSPFEITLEPGEYLDRFSVTFKPSKKKGKDEDEDEEEGEGEGEDDDGGDHKENNADSLFAEGDFLVYINNKTSELQITKPVDAEIITINLFNYLGQNIKSWNTNLNENTIYLPIKVSAGAYIVQINTKNGPVVHKVIVE